MLTCIQRSQPKRFSANSLLTPLDAGVDVAIRIARAHSRPMPLQDFLGDRVTLDFAGSRDDAV